MSASPIPTTTQERQALRDWIARHKTSQQPGPGSLTHLNPSRAYEPQHPGRTWGCRRCVYCGHWGMRLACFQHTDLLDLDERYTTPEDVAA